MPRGKQLSVEERTVILRLFDSGESVTKVAEVTGRSRRAVKNVIDNPDKKEDLGRSGRPSKLSSIAKRRLIRKASKGELSARELKVTLNLPLSVTRTRAILSETPHLRYEKMKQGPLLTPTHIERRKNWAVNHVTWTDEQWCSVIWSDEKNFNLDGPDGWGYHWHDLRKEKRMFARRQNGGGSVMVWAAFSGAGKSALAFIEGRQNAVSYCRTLEDFLCFGLALAFA